MDGVRVIDESIETTPGDLGAVARDAGFLFLAATNRLTFDGHELGLPLRIDSVELTAEGNALRLRVGYAPNDGSAELYECGEGNVARPVPFGAKKPAAGTPDPGHARTVREKAPGMFEAMYPRPHV